MSTYENDGRPASRRYRMTPRMPLWYYTRRQRRQRAVASPSESALERISNPENLLRHYRRLQATGGQAPGVDMITYRDFSTAEIAAALRQVSWAIREGHYKPYPTRLVRIPKGDGRHRELQLGLIVDRVVAAAVAEEITPILEREFLDGSYGFRPRRNVLQMLAAMEQQMIEQDRWVLAIDDVRDAFPSVRIADVMAAIRQFITDTEVLGLIETIARGDEGSNHIIGLDQGCP